MVMYATISADIVSSTALPETDLLKLVESIKDLARLIESRYEGTWVRLVKGDYIECVVSSPADALRVALLIKTYIKKFDAPSGKCIKDMATYGVRMAIGIANMRVVSRQLMVLDGEAIYISGRGVESLRNLANGATLIRCAKQYLDPHLKAVGLLLDAIVNDATRKQSEVLYLLLLGYKQTEIANKLAISQASVNRHASAAKWHCIRETLKYYERLDF